MFYPVTSSYRFIPVNSIYLQLEKAKKGKYGERLAEVEHGSFMPMVFSACGGMGKEATVVIKKITDALATKCGESYRKVVTWMRCHLAYSLVRSAIRCIQDSSFTLAMPLFTVQGNRLRDVQSSLRKCLRMIM